MRKIDGMKQAAAAAMVAGTVILAGCSGGGQGNETSSAAAESTQAAEAGASVNTASLVIAGGDGAGLVAAIQAVQEGLAPEKIKILAPGEDLAKDLAEMPGFINASNTSEQYEAEIMDDFEIYLADTMEAGNNTNQPEMTSYLAEAAEDGKIWLSENLGIQYGKVSKEEGSSVARSFPAAEGSLNELVAEALIQKVEELKIPVEYGVELKSVSMDGDGALQEITYEAEGKEVTLPCKALVATDRKLISLVPESVAYENAEGEKTALLVTDNAEVFSVTEGETSEEASEEASEEVSDEDSGLTGDPIPGIYAAGPAIEAAVYGDKAMAGNEMTAMTVFGMTAGTEAAIYISDNE